MEVALSKSLSSFNKSFNKSLCFYIHSTRTSPPGAVGAVGHPFGQSRLVDRNALRALLSASAPRMYAPFGASLPPSTSSPGVPLHPPKSVSCHSGEPLFRDEIGRAQIQKNISLTVQPVLITFPQSKVCTMGGRAPLICL